MLGKDYDVELKEGKSVVTTIYYSKDGKEFAKDRSWQSFEQSIDFFKRHRFVVAYPLDVSF